MIPNCQRWWLPPSGGGVPVEIGTLVENDFNSGNWEVYGSPLATFEVDGITFGSKSVNLGNYIFYKSYNNPDNIKYEATFNVLSDNPFLLFGSVGRGQIGGNSAIGWSIQLTNTGTILFIQQAGQAGNALAYNGATPSPPSAVVGSALTSDTLNISVEFIGSLINVDFTKNSTTTNLQFNTQFYNYGANSIRSLDTIFFENIAANVKMTSWKISSTSNKNVLKLGVGDSITQGYNAGSLAGRFPIIADIDINAGGGNTTQDVINNMSGILARNPQKVFLLIALNDDASGIADAVWQANYVTIVTTLEAAGITVVKLLYAGWGAFGTTVNGYITATYPSSYIDTATLLETSPGVINATYNAGDGHPNAAGHALIASTIMASPLY